MKETQTEVNKKKAEDLQEITEALNKRESLTQQTQPQPQPPPQAPAQQPPPPPAVVAPVSPTPTLQMETKQCPSCNKEITVPPDFEEGLCPYCRGYLDFRPKAPTEIPKRISDQAMAKTIKDQYAPLPQIVVPTAPTPAPTPTIPIPPPLAPIAPAPPIPPQPQPQYLPPNLNVPPQQNAPAERFIDKRAAAMDVMSWLNSYKTMCYVAIVGSFACLILGMFYLDLIGMIVLFTVTIYVALILKRVTTHENYLMQKYNLIKSTRKPKKPNLQKSGSMRYDNKLPPQQPPAYPRGQY